MAGTCTSPVCDRPLSYRGMCREHASRFSHTGDARMDEPVIRRRRPKTEAQCFAEKHQLDPETGCWRWTGAKWDGYGTFRQEPAHRAAWRLYVGPIPEGMTLDHLCHTRDEGCPGNADCLHRGCVNPEHLEPVPLLVNIMRGRGPAAMNARKTHCLRGHPLSGDNIYAGRPGRHCKTCARERNRKPAVPVGPTKEGKQ